MMKLLRFAWLQVKKGLKDKKVMGLSFVMPMLVITVIYFGMLKGDDSGTKLYTNATFNIMDQGNMANQMIEDLGIGGSKFYGMQDEALEVIRKGDTKAVYVIPADFSSRIHKGEKPSVTAYKNANGNSTGPVEQVMNDWINKKVQTSILVNNGIIKAGTDIPKVSVRIETKGPEKQLNMAQFFTILMIANFMIFSANGVSSELLQLKSQHIMKRALTTANKGYEIVGGIYLGFVVQQILIYSTVYLLSSQIMGLSLKSLPIIMVCVLLLSFVSTSLGILAVRIFNNESVVALTVNLVGIVTTFLGMAGVGGMQTDSSWIVQNLSKFTPQYWVLNSVSTSTLFPNVFVLMLMALVLFTAGNYKVRNFVNR